MKQIIRNYFENLPAYQENPFQISEDDLLIELGLLDSFGIIEFVSFLEESFDLDIDEDDLVQSNFESLKSIQQFVEMKLAEVS